MKLKFLFFVLASICFSGAIGAQNSEIDSIKTILKNSDTLTSAHKISFYLKLAKLNRRTNPKEQLLNARLAFSEAQKISDLKKQGIAISEIASHYQKADRYDSAYYYYDKSIGYFSSKKNIGNAYSRLSNVEKARGNYVQSIALLIKSDSLFEIVNFQKGRLASNTNLGILLSTQGDYQEAINYYKRAETFLDEKDIRSKSSLYTNFAITYNELGDIENSKKYTEQSLEIKKKLGDVNGLANAYGNLSMIASKEGNDTLSIQYLEQALAAYKKMNNKNGIAGIYTTLGGVYRTQGKFKKAEEYLVQAEKLAKETKNHDALMTNKDALYKLYRDTDQWEKAFIYLTQATSLRDSITQLDKIKITKELQTKYETERAEKEKVLADTKATLAEEQANTSEKFSIVMGVLGALILVIALLVFKRYKGKKKQEVLSLQLAESQKRLKLEQQTRISELKALQSQMNPHFVFNALNSIQDLILLQDIRNSNKYLGKFSDLIRRILANSNKGVVSISEELIMLKLYAELEQLRFGEQLEIEFINDITEEYSDVISIPAMFVQPYVENALKHGLLHKEGLKKLTVQFKKEAQQIVCKIEDNGVGRQKAQEIKLKGQANHLGFSTQANEDRVSLLNTGRAEKINIKIEDVVMDGEVAGTVVYLYFPIREG